MKRFNSTLFITYPLICWYLVDDLLPQTVDGWLARSTLARRSYPLKIPTIHPALADHPIGLVVVEQALKMELGLLLSWTVCACMHNHRMCILSACVHDNLPTLCCCPGEVGWVTIVLGVATLLVGDGCCCIDGASLLATRNLLAPLLYTKHTKVMDHIIIAIRIYVYQANGLLTV